MVGRARFGIILCLAVTACGPAVVQTPTLRASNTPLPTTTKTPTNTPYPTLGPTNTRSIEVSATPTITPTLTTTPTGKAFKVATATPGNPTKAAKASVTPKPTKAPKPTQPAKPTKTPKPSGGGDSCSPAYPDVCIKPPPPDLDCGDIPYRRFRVLPPDPHHFDGDHDGIGCES